MCYSVMVKRDMKKFGLGALHWVREDIEHFESRSEQFPKLFPPMKDRIFQGSYAPIVHKVKGGEIAVSPMRYGVYQPSFIKDPKIAHAFNARRDNLRAPYWSEAYEHHHGCIVISGFYEWVLVSDLLKANLVTISEIKLQFEKEIEERKKRIVDSGKKYAMTPTEKKDPYLRKTVIQFQSKDLSDLYVPVVFTQKSLEDGFLNYGFAIVTDDPQTEVLAAGHDRSPAFISKEAVMDWIELVGNSSTDFQNILDQKPKKYFVHRLGAAV